MTRKRSKQSKQSKESKPFKAVRGSEARGVIDTTAALVRALEQARLVTGMSKAELARRIETRPEIVRRLLTAPNANPTLATVLKLARALDLHLELAANRTGGKLPGGPDGPEAGS